MGFAIVALLFPLLVFAVEAVQNPALLEVRVEVAAINQSHVALKMTLSYVGTIPLTDVRLVVGSKSTDVGDLREGEAKTVTIPLSVDEALNLRPSDLSLRFKIMGIYGVEVRAAG